MLDVQTAAERWSLALGDPYDQGVGGHTTRATLADGTPVVLKVVHPHRESEHEADALRAWDGDGAIRLLAQDGDALLLERCEPGTPLSAAGQDAALDVLIELLPRLWRPAGEPFHSLADEAAWWFPKLPRTKLGDAARESIESLAGTQGEQVLLHQDLHGDNVLAAEREPWLVDRPEAARGRAGVRSRADRPLVGARRVEARRAAPLRPPHLGARPRSRARAGLDDRPDRRVVDGASNGEWHDSVAEWLL